MSKKKWLLPVGAVLFAVFMYQGYGVLDAADEHPHNVPKIKSMQALQKLDTPTPTVKELPGGMKIKVWRDKKGDITLNESPGNIDVSHMTQQQFHPQASEFEIITLNDGTKAAFGSYKVDLNAQGKVKVSRLLWSTDKNGSPTVHTLLFTDKFSKKDILEIAESATYSETPYETPQPEKEQIGKLNKEKTK